MPFVKVRKNLIVNTDHVARIDLDLEDNNAMLTFSNLVVAQAEISRAAASFLLDMLEVSQALDFNPKAENYQQTLTSRLAQILRDTQPFGATVAQLSALAGREKEATTLDALLTLKSENVVKLVTGDSGNHLWFHASHAPQEIKSYSFNAYQQHCSAVNCSGALSGVSKAEAIADFSWLEMPEGMLCSSCANSLSSVAVHYSQDGPPICGTSLFIATTNIITEVDCAKCIQLSLSPSAIL